MVYLDHHATTPVLPEVIEAMRAHESHGFGNAGSAHSFGRRARQALETARESIAHNLDAFPDEVIFTSGATEANNLAIFGLAGQPPGHLLASTIEHPCVVAPLKQIAARGFEVDWLPALGNGSVNIDAIRSTIRADTRLLALMWLNHETGSFQPIREACSLLQPDTALHCDASQAVGKYPIAFHDPALQRLTSLSASGHKIGAPQGIGILLVKRGVRMEPLFFGGPQQNERRPGTEPVALAVGFATALKMQYHEMESKRHHVASLKQRFLERLQAKCAPVIVNGDPTTGSAYVINLSFPGCRADLLLMKLDLGGVACSTGSACSSGSLLPSTVLRTMGLPEDRLRSALRFSFSSSLNHQDIEFASERIIKAINELRCDDSEDSL